MGFNYALEKSNFEREWAKLRKVYEKAGMTEEAIQSIYEFDLETFRSERTYASHTQALPNEHINEDELDRTTLFRKFVNSTVSFDESDFSGQYAWVDTIEDQRLVLAMRKLSTEELELITFLVLEEHTQQELARKWGCSQAAISQRCKKIKKFFK